MSANDDSLLHDDRNCLLQDDASLADQQVADEKERKLNNTANGCSKRTISDFFMAWMMRQIDLGTITDKMKMQIKVLESLPSPGVDSRRPRVDGKCMWHLISRKVECFNCHNTGHFAMESHKLIKYNRMAAVRKAKQGQDFKPVRTEKEAFDDHRMKVKSIEEDIDDSLYEYGKYGPQPQTPSPTVSNASSIVFSICPSNDRNEELGAASDASSTHYSTCQSNDTVNVNTGLGNVNSDSVHVNAGTQVKSGSLRFNKLGKRYTNFKINATEDMDIEVFLMIVMYSGHMTANRPILKIINELSTSGILLLGGSKGRISGKDAVNTALLIPSTGKVTQPQNKNTYKLLFGHKPILSYIRPFGCHVTILNTLSPLGKFDGKSDEGYLVGYTVNIMP
ncbi:hypothetical protein Tco_0296829 [Tanacetum coccineum]